MKVSIFGVGDIGDILNNTKMTRGFINQLLGELEQFLADKKCEIIIRPTRGIPYKLAVKFKENGGKIVIGAVAPNGLYYGKFYDTITWDYRHICDDLIEFNSWYDANGNLGTLEDATIVINFFNRSFKEICEMRYNIKYLNKNAKLFIFKKTVLRTLKGIELDLNAVYISSVKELRKTV